jgi:hypothetical protein
MPKARKLYDLIGRLTAAQADDYACLQAIFDSDEFLRLSEQETKNCRKLLASFVSSPQRMRVQPNNYIFASSLLIAKFDDRAGLDALRQVMQDQSDAVIKLSLFWNIVRYASLRTISYARELADLYFDLLKAWPIDQIDLTGLPPLNFDCIVLVSQFLTSSHAPTADAIDYCRILRKLGYNPLLINTNELPSEIPLPLMDAFGAEKRNDLVGMQNVNVDDCSLTMFTPSDAMPSGRGFSLTLAFIKAIKPKFCLFVGGLSLLQEEVGNLVPTIIMPTTVEFVPSRTCATALFGDLADSQLEIMTACGIDRSNVFDGYRYNYSLKNSVNEDYKRSQFGAFPHSFVTVIVGNRLPLEVDLQFKNYLHDMIKAIPNFYCLFVGPLDHATRKDLESRFRSSAGFVSYAQDLVSLYGQCDLYLNPKRQGGGSSAAYALAAGLPVYSLALGDVGKILPKEFLFNNQQQLFEGVKDYFVNERRKEARDLAHSTWKKISDRQSLLADILGRLKARSQQAA